MRKLMLSAVAMAVAATLIGCNDGSEFVERDKPEQTQSSGSQTLAHCVISPQILGLRLRLF